MEFLYNSKDNEQYLIKETPDVPLLNSLGIFEGSKIIKKATYKLGGPALVMVNSREVAIGKDIATLIQVERQ